MTDLFGLFQCYRCHGRHKSKCNDKAGDQCICNSQSQIDKELSCNSFRKNDRRVYTDGCQSGCNNRTGYLACALYRCFPDRVTLVAQAVNILDDNDRVIHEHSDSEKKSRHRNNIHRDSRKVHEHNRSHYRKRNRTCNHNRRLDIL